MRRYFLMLVFAAGGETIIECDADDDPVDVARKHHAPMYRKYETRADAERWRLAYRTGAGVMERGEIVNHNPGTAHFRCTCGERLVFSEQSPSLRVLVGLRHGGGVKIGACPKCARIHSTRSLLRV